jgi:hypothetical protein
MDGREPWRGEVGEGRPFHCHGRGADVGNFEMSQGDSFCSSSFFCRFLAGSCDESFYLCRKRKGVLASPLASLCRALNPGCAELLLPDIENPIR